MDNTNLIMRVKIAVNNEGKTQILAAGYSFKELESTRYELMDSGYTCEIVEDLGELHLVVGRKEESFKVKKRSLVDSIIKEYQKKEKV